MHDEPSRSRFSDLSTARQDRLVQAGVLVHVLDLHPVSISVSELVRQMTLQPDHFGEEDAIKRAVYELAGDRLASPPRLPQPLGCVYFGPARL